MKIFSKTLPHKNDNSLSSPQHQAFRKQEVDCCYEGWLGLNFRTQAKDEDASESPNKVWSKISSKIARKISRRKDRWMAKDIETRMGQFSI